MKFLLFQERTKGHLDVSVIILSLILIGFLLARFAAPLFNLLPPCTFRTVIGLPCPTCGSTRAGLALAQGDFVAAVSYNPLFVIGLVVLAAWSFASALECSTGKFIPDVFLKKITANSGLVMPASRRQPFLRWLVVGAVALNWLYLIVTT